MSVAHPWALALLALLPLLWLVRHEPPRQRVTVAGRFLWTPRPRRDSTLGTAPAHHTLLWIQAALLGTLIVALAGPRVETAPDTIAVVLDASMSMAARDPEGLRLTTAGQRVIAALEAQGTAARVRVWAAAAIPVLIGDARTGANLESLLAAVTPTDGWANLEAAVARAEQDRPRPRRIYVVSDRQAPLQATNVEWLGVGRAADNLAVTSLVAGRDPDRVDRVHLLVDVHNFGSRDARTDITVSVDGLPPSRHAVEVASRRTASVGVVLDGSPRGVVSARIDAQDALAADNVRYAVVAPATAIRIAVDGTSRFIEAALASHRGMIRASPDGDAGLLKIGAASGETRLPLTVTRAEHPVVKGVTLDGLEVAPTVEAAVPEGVSVLARAGNRPVIVAGDNGGRRVVELRFDTTDAALALEPSFPLLVANIVDWLNEARQAPDSVRAGDPFRWPTSGRAVTAATASGPAGRPVGVAEEGDAVMVGNTSTAGAYQVERGGERVTFVANPATDGESDLQSVPAPARPQEPGGAGTTAARDLTDLAPALFVVALILIFFEWRARAVLARGARRSLPWPRLVSRVVAAALVIAALAGLRVWTGSAPVAVAFTVDRSDSTIASVPSWLNATRELTGTFAAGDQAGLTVFGETAVVERRVQEGQLPWGALESAVTPSGTNIERALQTARASLPPEGDRRIILFSDGHQTSGDAAREAMRAAADGVRIDVVPARTGRPSARATRMTAPATVRVDEPFDVAVVIEGPAGVVGDLQLLGAGPARSRRLTIPAHGVGRVVFPERADTGGLRTYRATFTPDSADFAFEGVLEAQAGAVVAVAGIPRVLYAGRHPGVVAPALRAAGFQVDWVMAGGLPDGPMLSAFDAVVLDEVDPLALSAAQRTALVRHVDLGGGLLVLGNEVSLPPGSSGDADFDALLPVDPRPRGGERGSALALVVAFDKSGSMEERVAGTPKLEFARQAVRNVMAALPASDAVGVIAFDSAPAAVAPLSTSRDSASLETALRAVRPAGATAIGPALTRAAEWLNAPAAAAFDKKHVLLISDGQTSADDLSSAARAVESGRLVLSVVAVGAGPDRQALESLAQRSGGRAYFADDVRDLPNAVAREASRVAGGRIVAANFEARLGAHPLARGLAGAPRLGGYVVTAARPDTDVVLRSHLDDPILAIGRRGLGRVAVYTADLHSSWSSGLVRWSSFGTLVTRTVRWVSRAAADSTLHASMRGTPAGIEIDVEAADGAALLSTPLEVRGTLRAPSGGESELTFTALAPGRYVATSPIGAAGAYAASITAAGADGAVPGTLVRGLYYAAPQELVDAEPDLALLRQVAATTGGRVLPLTGATIDGRRPGYRDGRPWFAGVALLLLFSDLVVTGAVRAVADARRRLGRQPQEQAA